MTKRGEQLITCITNAFPCAGERMAQDYPMARHSTFRVGGPADTVFFPSCADELVFAARHARNLGIPVTILGNGSNILVSDRGIRGFTIILGKHFSGMEKIGTGLVVAQAGALLSETAAFAADHSLTGMEFAAGIPGTIGGAICMNAGAYDGCMAGIVLKTQGYSPQEDRLFMIEDKKAHRFDYRTSFYSSGEHIVLTIWLELQPGDKAQITAKMADFAARRKQTQPLELPSAGSTFKRPEGYFAGKLIEEAGLKGYRIGGAAVCEKHAGFIVNDRGATAKDIDRLMRFVQQTVLKKHGVWLDPEVRLIGEWSTCR